MSATQKVPATTGAARPHDPIQLQPCTWQAFDAVMQPLALADARGRLVYANRAFRALAPAVSDEGAASLTLEAVFGPERAAGLCHAIGAGEARSESFELELGAAAARHVRVSLDPLPEALSGGDIVGPRALVLCRDITRATQAIVDATERELALKAQIKELEASSGRSERHAAEVSALTEALMLARAETERANAAKSEFLAMMSHEIRTPLNSVMGMIWLLMQSELDPKQRDHAETAKDSADALLTVINGVLDFSKMEAGRLELERIAFDLPSVVGGVIKQFESKALEKSLALRSRLEPSVPGRVMGDPTRLRQILHNLVGNALKFTERGSVSVRVSRLQDQARGSLLRFEVRDTGIGIAEDERPKLFQKFARLDDPLARRHGGSGLGLAICQRLAALMGGEIGLESRPGIGSNFWLVVPLEPAPVAAARPMASDLSRTSALIVVATGERRTALADRLRPHVYESAAVGSIAEGLEALRAIERAGGRHAVVLFAADALAGDATLFAREVRADKTLKNVSLVLMVKAGLRGDASRSRELGYLAYLTEPLDDTLVIRCLRELVGGHEVIDNSEAPIITVHSLREETGRVPVALIAEDHPVNQRLAAALVERMGCAVIVVGDGVAAVEAVKAGGIDIVLMDVRMPGMDGLSATRAIRALPGDACHVPIIAVTGHGTREEEDRCLAAGVTDHVAKPIEPERLRRALLRWIKPQDQASSGASKTARQAPGSNLPVIDEALLDRLEGSIGKPSVADLAWLYLDTTGERLAALDQALARHDAAAVRQEAHDLKSTSGNLGASQLFAQVRALERAAKTAAFDEIALLAAPVRDQFEAVRASFEARYPR